jgi:hypothetical protein
MSIYRDFNVDLTVGGRVVKFRVRAKSLATAESQAKQWADRIQRTLMSGPNGERLATR